MNSLRQQLSLLVIRKICPGGVDLLERATQRSLRLFVRIFEENHEVVVEELLWQVRVEVLICFLVEVAPEPPRPQRQHHVLMLHKC